MATIAVVNDSFDEPVETAVSHGTLPSSRRVPVIELRAEGLEKALALDRPWTLGSAAEVDVPLAGRTVSRLHARIESREGLPWIVDLHSTNGTRVDGLRVGEAALPDGARLSLGETCVTIHHTGRPRESPLWPTERFGQLIGRSAAARALFERLERIARSDANVLVHGETGTGKDLVARAVHDGSPRAGGPFLVFDCAAIPENLFESELFGHARGAFTGASRAREGAAAAADGGTLFLDEVGELPLHQQPKLLRFLETGTVRRVGETGHRRVDVRVVAATHRDLAQMVGSGTFREDLYFRLVVLPVDVPPLRARPEDVPLLMEHFAAGRALSSEVLERARSHPWPGNVRELRTFVERVLALGPHEALRLRTGLRSKDARAGSPLGIDLDVPLRRLKEEAGDAIERGYLEGWARRTGRNVTAMAEGMGLDRSYVHRLLRKHEL